MKKENYSQLFLILFLGVGFESLNFLKNANAHSLNSDYQKENVYLKRDKKIYFGKKNRHLINKSFYKHGYTFEESLKPKNQLLDLFGISIKNKSSSFSFPEQRIESDSFIFWETYENSLETQIPKKYKLTKDLDNGFNTSLYP